MAVTGLLRIAFESSSCVAILGSKKTSRWHHTCCSGKEHALKCFSYLWYFSLGCLILVNLIPMWPLKGEGPAWKKLRMSAFLLQYPRSRILYPHLLLNSTLQRFCLISLIRLVENQIFSHPIRNSFTQLTRLRKQWGIIGETIENSNAKKALREKGICQWVDWLGFREMKMETTEPIRIRGK